MKPAASAVAKVRFRSAARLMPACAAQSSIGLNWPGRPFVAA
jgi:hypothetical protein